MRMFIRRWILTNFQERDVKTLVGLEDLGRGSTGKVQLCGTVTQPYSAACVLKFDNEDREQKLMKERDMWHLLCP